MDHSAIVSNTAGMLSAPVLRPQWVALYAWTPDSRNSIELRFPIRDMERARKAVGIEPESSRLRRLSQEVVPAARIFLDCVLLQGESWQSLAAKSPITVRLPH